MTVTEFDIRPLDAQDYPAFFDYFNAQLAENGKNGSPLFQPVSRHLTRFPHEKEAAFVAGLAKTVGRPGGRRAWIAVNSEDEIAGHVDLRGPSDPYSVHRALLGMGVRKSARRRGLGRTLVAFACDWVLRNKVAEWIDIEVMTENIPAIRLYESTGFTKLCEMEDMFRIDGRPEGVIRMTKRIIPDAD